MRRTASIHGYPVFTMPEGIEYWDPIVWLEMIEVINPSYLLAAGRLPPGRLPGSIRALDAVVLNSEGDEWVLSLLELEYPDERSELFFFPLMRTVLPASEEHYWLPLDKKLLEGPELIAYGVNTRSSFSGPRKWVVYDAFLGEEIPQVLLALFSVEASFSHLSVSESDRGEFRFVTDAGTDVKYRGAAEVAFDDEMNIAVTCDALELRIPRDLRSWSPDEVDARDGVVGRIEYRGAVGESTLIGVLQHLA